VNTLDALQWTSSARTNVGCVRKINEDACLDSGKIGLWVVADGMGGHAAGDLASSSIVAALADIEAPDSLSQLVDAVEDRLFAVNRQLREEAARREGQMIGSTVVALLAWRRHCVCLWAGDSRIYRLRAGRLEQLTRDHSQVEEMIDQGELLREDAASHPAANVITRAVGADDELFVDVALFDLEPGDRFLLCSDGLYKEISDEEFAIHLATMDAAQASQDLLSLALERGARDNVTIIVMQVMEHA
jgi:serine/threonine protein phosphatase PrpC